MRRLLFGVFVVAAALAVPLAGSAAFSRSSSSVRITYITPKLVQGGTVGVRALVSPSTQPCTLSLHGPTGATLSRRAAGGTARRQWLVPLPLTAAPGRWTATVSCAGVASASRSFQVGTKIVPAQVVVTRSGFTQGAVAVDPQSIYYGLVLTNTSAVSDARDVDVSVSFTDSLGRSVLTDEKTVSLIPAGGTFYFGGEQFPTVSFAVANIKATVTVRSSTARRIPLPMVSGVSVNTDSFGDRTATGSFTNPYKAPLAQDAAIDVVAFNAAGEVLGGSYDFAGAAVQPGQTVSFSRELFGLHEDQVATVTVSVDPCGLFAGSGGCPAING